MSSVLKVRGLTYFWLRLMVAVIAFCLTFMLSALVIGRVMAMEVVAYVSMENDSDRRRLHIMDVNRRLSSKVTDQGVTWCCLSWSPDGDHMVFTSSVNGQTDIFIVDVFDGRLRQLTDSEVNDYGAVWSPDGSAIAYASELNGNSDMYVTDLPQGQTHRLTDFAIGVYSPVWSPDGQYLIYIAPQRGGNSIYRVKADGSDLVLLSQAQDVGTLALSPDGQQVLFHAPSGKSKHSDIFIVDVSGQNKRQLTSEGAALPSWSPDGEQIAFSASGYGTLQIYVMDRNGDHERQLTHHRWNDLQPLYSPDGQHILFLAADSASYSLYLIDADGRNERQLATNVSYIIPPRWRP